MDCYETLLRANGPRFTEHSEIIAETKSGRGERIRTSGPCLPKTVLYQAELLPDRTRAAKRRSKARVS